MSVHENKDLFALSRDLSMNLLASVPTAGLNALNQLKLSGNVDIRSSLSAVGLPKLR